MPKTNWLTQLTKNWLRHRHQSQVCVPRRGAVGRVARSALRLEEMEQRVMPAGTLSIGNTTFNLAAGDVGFVVTRSGDLTPAVDVDYSVTQGTAITGVNYTTLTRTGTGVLHFATGQTTATIPLSILPNNFPESTRSFAVDLLRVVAPDGPPTFATQVPFATATGNFGPFSVASADVNGDGLPDVITTNESSGTVSVLLNTTVAGAAIPTFASQVPFPTGSSPKSVAMADVNRDGKPDILVANGNGGSGRVSVLLNNTTPSGTTPSFATQVPFPLAVGTAFSLPLSVASADVNGDGKPDILVTDSVPNKVGVLLNTTGDGDATPTFTGPTFFALGKNNVDPLSVASADVNGDGKPDILVANGLTSGTVSVLLNTTTPGGTLSFANQVPFTTGPYTTSVATTDVNSDGRPDIIATVSPAHEVQVLLNITEKNATTPTFAAPGSFDTGIDTGPTSSSAADVNGDGLPDLVVANYFSDTVSVLLNKTAPGASAPTFADQVPFPTGTSPASVVTADVNSDGRPDLVVANFGSDNVSVLLNTLDVLGNHHGTGTIDSAPVVQSLVQASANPSHAASVSFTITFSEAVSGLTASNFALTGTATAGATIGTPTSNGGITWTVPVTTGVDGTLGLSLVNRTGIVDGVGNKLYNTTTDNGSVFNPVSGPQYTIDKTAPTVNITGPSVSITKGGPVIYTVTYPDPDIDLTDPNSITLSAADITLNKTPTTDGTVTVSGTAGTNFRTVTITGTTGNGTLGISIAAGTAKDKAGNPAAAAGPSNTFEVDNAPLVVNISAPSAPITAGGPIIYTIDYTHPNLNPASITLSAANITLNRTGTANGVVTVSGTGATRTVTISGTTGDGTLGLSIAAGTAADSVGNLALAAGPSTTFRVENTAPIVNISAPSAPITAGGPVTFTVTYTDPTFTASTLKASDITLNRTGTANGIVSVDAGTGLLRTVTISGITGNGTLGISIAAGTAHDAVGNLAPAAGPSTTFAVDNAPLDVVISPPSAPIAKGGPVTYTINYPDANFSASTLKASNITLNKTGTANGIVSVDAGTGRTRTVTISGITGNGTLGISIAAGTASDTVGNLALPAGPSTTFEADNITLIVNISAPSAPTTKGGPVTYTINYPDADFQSSTLKASDITLNRTGTANGIVSVDTGTGRNRTVTISGVTGNGTLGISIAAGTATDTVGNVAGPAGPSTTFQVANIALFAIGGADGSVRIVNANTGGTISTVRPLDTAAAPYKGLVEVAFGDFNHDGIADLVVSAANPMGLNGLDVSKAGKAFLYDGAVLGAGTLSLLHTFTPFANTDGPGGTTGAYTNGLNIAAGDINGDGKVDLVAGTRGITATTGTAEYGRLVVINEGAATNGSADTIIGSILTPFGATYSKGVIVAAGNLDGVGGDEVAVTRGGPVAATNPNKAIKLKAYKFNGSGLTELDLNGAAPGAFAPFPAIERDGRVAFVDPNGDGKQDLVFSALDRTNPANTQVRIAVFDVNTTTGLATAVSTGTGPSNSYLVSNHIQDHATTHVDLAQDGTSDLALITENSAPGALSGMLYLAPLSGAILPGGFSLNVTTGGVSIDGI
ncbi:MAG: FG-GAP-like repeat-containing protein [Planctomycetes bacterium]|nr:FG-GAP-like repeat-containing protein [Planctomycetota bacterium]